MTETTRRRVDWQQVLRWFAATLGVGMATGLLALAGLKEMAASLVFLTMVVWVAARTGIARALYVALLCALCFDYFFLQPVHTFRLAGWQQWIETEWFLVSS